MLKIYRILLVFIITISSLAKGQVSDLTLELNIDYSKATINTRFVPPAGYVWVKEEPGSFGEFLSNFPLYPKDFPIRDYKKVPIEKQYHHAAILKIDVGEKDLQQCADAWMRMYAEYLWLQKRSGEVEFQFTSGQKMSWNDFKKGIRTTEDGEKVKFHKSARYDDSYQNFRKYLNLVFNYAGTISLDRESVPVTKNQDIKTGDFLIIPGSPGHTAFIVGTSKNSAGKKLYLLAESYMPAQDVHLLINPLKKNISPWYELDVNSPYTVTAKYIFKPTSIKRFHALAK